MQAQFLKKCFLFIIALTVFAFESEAQKTISGKVTDREGNPLPDVTVQVKGTNNTTLTNRKGDYSIVTVDTDSLIFTSVGYSTRIIAVTNREAADVKLSQDIKPLEDVVVVGYGTQKKRDLTGAVSSVKTKDLVISSGPEIGNMLKGKVAGLIIRQNSAQPGGGLDILIRGAGSVNASNAPLFVVDGFPISDLQQPESGGRYQAGTQSILSSFNPNDIESIEVLKDASATSKFIVVPL